MDDLTWKRIVNANIKRSNEILEKELEELYANLYETCTELKSKIHESSAQLDKRTLGKTADLAILGALIRFTANWSLRLADKTEKQYDWQMTPDQTKHLCLDFFSQLFDNELELEDKFIKEQVKTFLETLKKSKLTKAVGDKQDVFREEAQRMNREMTKKTEVVSEEKSL